METTLPLYIATIGFSEIVLLLFFLAVPVGLWLWALLDLLSSEFENGSNKVVWLMAITFLPVLGALLYLLIGRNQKVTSLPQQ
ncbi:PLD nuclease N-terminal domain-containing protein [uncultured Pontibacter sp.]|uniref:PLD nuclease N-terminal domain-containing protein n=1 Tax=uncultured Pontibacter sp. TaxID=453356 RepID=UPI0026353374|nr:PLD nuclease N-terminal domain-containing protein [uncultured Pontibacter sp.]